MRAEPARSAWCRPCLPDRERSSARAGGGHNDNGQAIITEDRELHTVRRFDEYFGVNIWCASGGRDKVLGEDVSRFPAGYHVLPPAGDAGQSDLESNANER